MDYSLTTGAILSFAIAFAVTILTVPPIRILAVFFKLVDDPKKRSHPAHTHKGIIPRAGGLALFLGIAVPSFFLLPPTPLFTGILIGAAMLTVTGLLDDHHDVNPFIRLGINAAVTCTVIFLGATIPYITNPFTGGVIHLTSWSMANPFFPSLTIHLWSVIIAFVWIMWTMNIIGWSSGVDGQMPGFVAISAAVIGLLSLRYSIHDPTQLPVTFLAFIVTGAFAGFVPWNFYPQKIMPGYGGKTLAGFLLALLAILSYAKLGTALLVLGIPMIDAVYTLIRRIGSKKSPVRADRGHLHHRLLELGWGRRRIALFYWVVSAILGAIALTVKSQQKLFAMLLFTVIISGFIVWVNFFTEFSKQHDRDNG